MINYTRITLGSLLSSANEIIKRNATSILKQLQRQGHIADKEYTCNNCGEVSEKIANFLNGDSTTLKLCEDCLDETSDN